MSLANTIKFIYKLLSNIGNNLIILNMILCVMMNGCLDYIKWDEVMNEITAYPPVIDLKHLSPHPSRLTEAINVGKNCRGEIFKIPPIKGKNHHNPFYYLWFFDNKLVSPKASIDAKSRDMAIITLTIDEQFLLSHFGNKLPKDFFTKIHIIDFFVSDIDYVIPETRYLGDEKYNETDHVDHAYWMVFFSDDPC